MASQSNDPRLPSAARPYKPPVIAQQDLPVDYSGFIAVVFGVFGAMFRVLNCFSLSPIYVFTQYFHLILINVHGLQKNIDDSSSLSWVNS